MIKELVNIANELDSRGLTKEAQILDGLLDEAKRRIPGGIFPSNERGEKRDSDEECANTPGCQPVSDYPQGGRSYESSRGKTSTRLNETFEIIIPPAHDMSDSTGETWRLETNLEYNDQVELIREKNLGYRKIYTFSAKGFGNTSLVFSQFSGGGGTRTGVNHVHIIEVSQ